jgi:hypothetical protein
MSLNPNGKLVAVGEARVLASGFETELTEAETRFLLALCDASKPLPLAPSGYTTRPLLTRALMVSIASKLRARLTQRGWK